MRYTCTIITSIGLMLQLTACNNDIEPFVEGEVFFSINGVLDANADTQYVRVEPARNLFERPDLPTLDAQVTSTDLQTGAIVVWQDSLVQLGNGQAGHLLFAPFRVVPGHRYRFEVRRIDGVVASAETTIPQDPALTPLRFISQTNNRGVFWEQDVEWSPIERPPFLTEVTYQITRSSSDTTTMSVTIPYIIRRSRESIWRATVHLTNDLERFRNDTDTLAFVGIRMSLQLLGTDWPAPSASSNPIPFSNVTNGRGFLGATNQISASWRLDSMLVKALGFTDQQP